MNIAVRRALYGKLAGDTTLTNMLGDAPAGLTHAIYDAVAPGGAEFPYVIFNQTSGVPAYTFKQGHAFLDNELWLIKGVDHNDDSDPVDAIADRLEALLTDGVISISGAEQLYLRAENPVRYTEPVDGEIYRHAGHNFRLRYSAT